MQLADDVLSLSKTHHTDHKYLRFTRIAKYGEGNFATSQVPFDILMRKIIQLMLIRT